ncbi:MAG: lactate racemase domain-containing protein [Pirellulales bacterium]|nr:lactate racemase domain-containing protein [Pirellulales bacterium]
MNHEVMNHEAMNQSLSVPWSAWNEETQFDLVFPGNLRPELLAPRDAPAWDDGQVRAALDQPIGSGRLSEIASSCQTACIAVDDLARPTRAGDVLTHLLNDLRSAGLATSRCTIVIATGTHGSLTATQIEKKIGAEAFRCGAAIEVHDPSKLCPTGILYGKEELHINRSFLEADLKLGISGVLPHSFAGFSGGAKMMLPGLANVEATARSHKFVQMGLRGGQDLDKNRFRQEIEALARQLGFEFTICVVTNSGQETCGVYAGDLVQAHRAACDAAQVCYRTPCEGTYDAMVVNAFPKDGDLIQAENAMIAFKPTGFGVVKEDGVIVLCTAAGELGVHGLFAPGGVSYREPGPNRVLQDRELWILAPHLDEALVRKRYWQGYRFFSDAQALGEALETRLGSAARVGVLPCAPMQQLVRGNVA